MRLQQQLKNIMKTNKYKKHNYNKEENEIIIK